MNQKSDSGAPVPIGFYSRALTSAELNFSASELECLSAVWITKKLRHLISFSPFELELNTDHRGLVTLLMKKELGNAQLEHWAMHLQPLRMRIRYLAGKSNPADWGVHLGFEQTFMRIHEHYFWPNMHTDVHQWVGQLARAFPIEDTRAAAKFLWDNIVMPLGAFEVMQSDRGTTFINTVVVHIVELADALQRLMTGYRPQANRLPERLVFGSDTCTPIDVATKGPVCSRKLTAYVENIKCKMAAACKAAQEFEKDYHAVVQRHYNAGRIDPGYVVGEKVCLAMDLLLKKETVGPVVVCLTHGVEGDKEVKTVHVKRLKRGDVAASVSVQRRIGDYIVAERSAAGAGQGTLAQ
eukprot:m51a1_g171 putative gag polymerase env (353) ;mRNA; r:570223-572274